MRRLFNILVLLSAAAVVTLAGVIAGIELANARWVSDMNRLGTVMQRLDQDIEAGRASPRDAEYLGMLSDLPLEGFDDKSVTYYAGPYARYSATIEFDQSGVKGLTVH